VREYHDREEWEFHVNRMHLLHIQFACSLQGGLSSFGRADVRVW
jgi:hypothetical protein